ncbi:MOT12-like protein [Mya arenaria]|uniref:MOT12-like protein n=1 Tax=Mya arenaria TaxID=6604 RepID=A0ABY7EE62_MYAAR|nr:monocarboxylate transporter 12-like [Mya arenaria]XP_052810964.1 monocarboxylate transporter 12-like [Mya arenaria]WAR07131.1 MOT12-like protein [Mya arenaria]
MRMKMQARKEISMLHGDAKPVTRIDFGDHYPEGGWGWTVVAAATVVYILCNGIHFAFSSLLVILVDGTFNVHVDVVDAVWLGSIGMGVASLLSPVVTTVCRRKSPRLYAVIGGLVVSLGCLFFSFAEEVFHLFISYCVVLAIGSGITVTAANIMVGRYFRTRRELAEMVMVSGTGAGAALLAFIMDELIRKLRWEHAMHAIAGVSAVTMVAGALYRSASLYHPRRNVIMHIKNQKKCRRERDQEKPPYFDFAALRMRALQGIMVTVAVIGLGMHVPYILLLQTARQREIPEDSLMHLNVYLGAGYVVGCYVFGYLVIRNSAECSISRRHLAQSCVLASGLCTLLFVMARDMHAFSLYAWLYGITSGGYYYTVKMYTYGILKERIMERGWGFVNAAQILSFLLGPPLAIYLNESYSSEIACYVFSGCVMVVGGLMFYCMPLFERHPSNQDIVQHYQSACSKNTTEAAALLDLDLTNAMVTKPLNNVQFIVSPSRMKHNHGKDTSKIQMQCFIQHRDKEKPKQIVLSRITEEKEGLRLDFNEVSYISTNSKSCSDASGRRKSLSDRDLCFSSGDNNGSEIPSEGVASHQTDRSKGSHASRAECKFRRSSDNVKLEFFDPPSQEKESTATVSYDSDLYINLCEAQV